MSRAPQDSSAASANSAGSAASKPKNRKALILHEAFRAGITLKGLDGILEVIGGALLWFVNPRSMDRMVRWLFQHELSRDPHDFIATHVLHATGHFTREGKTFATIYLVSHGLVKIVLVTALWMDELWAYPLFIAVFLAFCVYQVYRFSHTHSITLVLLTIFDLVIVWLTWQEYRAQKAARGK